MWRTGLFREAGIKMVRRDLTQGSQGHGSVNRRCSGPVVVILGQRERRLPRRREGQRSGMARAFRRAFGEGRVPGRDASLPSVRLGVDPPRCPGSQRKLPAVPGRPQDLPQLPVP